MEEIKFSKELTGAMSKLMEAYREETGYDESEPMDGDEVERLAKIFYCFCDFQQGNLTWEEYQEKLAKIK